MEDKGLTPKRIRALLFDFDGLILDTEEPLFQAWQEIYADHSQQLDLGVWADHVGKASGTFDAHRHLEELLGHSLNREETAVLRRRRNNELLLRQSVLPGIESYLSDAEGLGLQTAIVSGSPKRWVLPHLERLHLVAHFALIVSKDDVQHGKPNPEAYDLCLSKLGILKSEAIAFEDSPTGVSAAKAAGLYCVAVPNKITSGLSFRAADLVLTSLSDMTLNDLIARAQAPELEQG